MTSKKGYYRNFYFLTHTQKEEVGNKIKVDSGMGVVAGRKSRRRLETSLHINVCNISLMPSGRQGKGAYDAQSIRAA